MLAPNASKRRLRWWRLSCSGFWPANEQDKKVIKEVRHVLLERKLEVSDSRAALIAWVPLTGCVEEIISTAISLSSGPFFHDDGRRQRQRREDESFHEWHVVVQGLSCLLPRSWCDNPENVPSLHGSIRCVIFMFRGT